MNSKTNNLDLKKIKVKLNIMLLIILALITYIAITALHGKKSNANTFFNEVIYAKGIVIVDEAGKDRILIGAPIPKSKYRVRGNIEKSRKEWPQFELDKEWDWYEDMNHDCIGMLVLDKNGHDKLAMGSPTPDPNIGIRIGAMNGVQINDEKGFERSGYGVLNVNGKNRVNLGIDDPLSNEGAVLSMHEDGSVGLSIRDHKNKNYMYMGKSYNEDYFFGIALRDSLGVKRIEKKK